ncbi:MAG: DeoR family transcriptional regulator [Acidobacteria bacterium]|nr:DeoR family transcriptional regulator [Acidobacteriota bacterium]
MSREETAQRVEVVDLSRRLHVSKDTIRRDLRDYANQRLLLKTHGGAVKYVTTPRSFENRLE